MIHAAVDGGNIMKKISVVGAGVMGTALAIHVAKNNFRVNLWGTKWDESTLKEMCQTGRSRLLDQDIPDNIELFFEDGLENALEGTGMVILAVSSAGLKSVVEMITPYLGPDSILLSITKGIDEERLCTMSRLIEEILPGNLLGKVAVVKLGGPLRANELAWNKYAEGVFASKDREAARCCQQVFSSPKFRAGITTDIEGVELCAALKNAYAIAIGMVEGLEGEADNPKAALMARGSVEMAEILKANGCNGETALGIAGVGDYYVTAQGGRNRTLGKLIGEGNSFDEALRIMKNQTVEGVPAAKSGYMLVTRLQEQGKLNIKEQAYLLNQLYRVLFEGVSAAEAMEEYWKNEKKNNAVFH